MNFTSVADDLDGWDFDKQAIYLQEVMMSYFLQPLTSVMLIGHCKLRGLNHLDYGHRDLFRWYTPS
jgi:hypothetical protein